MRRRLEENLRVSKEKECRKMENFQQVVDQYQGRLVQYVPVVARVHGESHREFYEVQKIFEEMIQKIYVEGVATVALQKEFQELRQWTMDYSVPGDVCESYEAVYLMLAALDSAYDK